MQKILLTNGENRGIICLYSEKALTGTESDTVRKENCRLVKGSGNVPYSDHP